MTAHDQISTPLGFAEFVSEWFGVSVPTIIAIAYSSEARSHRERWETAAGPFCWVKNRLLEQGYFDPGRNTPPCGGITAIMHVGFLCIRETPEMLDRLKNERREEPAPARSRFASAINMYAVSPIDATAGRVSPGDAK